jgi:Recombinase
MKPNARKVPYGWKAEGDRQVKDVAAQKVIMEILEQSRKGYSLVMIARDLNERGIPTHRGGRWHGSTVGNVIRDNTERIPEPLKANPKPRLPSVESMEEAIERRLREDPNATSFQWEDVVWDEDTGQQKSVPVALHIESTKQWLIESAKRRLIEAEALKNLTVAEQAETFRFYEPVRLGFGTSWGEGARD